MFLILWPTIRPGAMKGAYASWIENAKNPKRVKIKVAVNTPEERARLSEFKDVLVVGSQRRGPCWAVHNLTMALEGKPKDIVILASDDFFPPHDWDVRLKKEFEGFDGALLVNDGVQNGPIMTIPIMTFSCLLKLNRILNHPEYQCFSADMELHDNLSQMRLIKNLRGDNSLVFEHRHWVVGKRKKDHHDHFAWNMQKQDTRVYAQRKYMPLAERLKA